MPFCATCGSPVEGRFCAKCGSPVEAGPAPGPQPGGGVPPAGAPQSAPASTGMSENTAAGLCYLVGLITGILFLVLEPYNKNKNVRFHAFQSIFLNVGWIVVLIVVGIVLNIIFAVLHILALSLLIVPLMWLAFLALWLYVMIMAFQGKTVVLPIIGPLAQKQA